MAHLKTLSPTEATLNSPLAPGPLLQAWRQLAAQDPRVRRIEIGHSQLGRPVEAFRCGKARPLLFYGFPDPGEALGAFGVLRWARSKLASQAPGDWIVVPVVDVDGQPDWKVLQRPIHSPPGSQSVDLFGGEDPILQALAQHIVDWEPRATIALHDEWHGDEPLPVYAFTTFKDTAATDSVRSQWSGIGLPTSQEWSCPLHGPGFISQDVLDTLPNGTIWAAARRSGPCAAIELSQHPNLGDPQLADLQIKWTLELVGESEECAG